MRTIGLVAGLTLATWIAGPAAIAGKAEGGGQGRGGYRPYQPKQPATLAMVGLGKMGGRMAERLMQGGHTVIAFDSAEAARASVVAKGAVDAATLRAAVDKMPAGQRVIWVMVPAGKPTDQTIRKLTRMLAPGDVIIDGGNSNFNDTVRRGAELKKHGIHLVDVGTSGGVWGAKRGYSLMIGGDRKVVDKLRPIFQTLAPGARTGWGRFGVTGAGHRAKMIHNAMEYGMMGAIDEMLTLAASGKTLKLDPLKLTKVWGRGSVVSSWLIDLTRRGLEQNPKLVGVGNVVPDSGEGRWAVKDAVDRNVPANVLGAAVNFRIASQQGPDSPIGRFQQIMRAQFGGHAIVPEKEKKE